MRLPIRQEKLWVSAMMARHGHSIGVEYERDYSRDGLRLVPYCKQCNRTLCAPSRDVFVRESTFEDWPVEAWEPALVAVIADAVDRTRCRCPQ